MAQAYERGDGQAVAIMMGEQATELPMFGGTIKKAGNVAKAVGKVDVDKLIEASKVLDKGDLTLAGRALQKHGNREGSSFPSAQGNPNKINEQAQKIVLDILNNPHTVIEKNTGRFGQVVDIIAPDGRGLRYSTDGKLIGFLEPSRK